MTQQQPTDAFVTMDQLARSMAADFETARERILLGDRDAVQQLLRHAAESGARIMEMVPALLEDPAVLDEQMESPPP